MVAESLLKRARGLELVLAAAVRATVHATLVAALLTLVGWVPTVIFPMNLRSIFLSLLLVPLCVFLIWILLLTRAARDISLKTPFSEDNHSYEERMSRIVMPVAFVLGGLVLLSLIASRPIHLGWLFGEEPLLGLALGYLVAPLLIRRRVLARLLESLGSG